MAPGAYHIRISSVGYEVADKYLLLKSGDSTVLHLVLTSNRAMLNEVVVTGVLSGTRIQENPIAIVSVTSKAIRQTTAGNIIDVLVKHVPGLNAVQTGPNISKAIYSRARLQPGTYFIQRLRQEGQQWGDEHGLK